MKVYYHGTALQRGNSMLKKKKMEYSRGDDQWLGEGIYLYEHKLYAFRWIVIKYKEKFNPSRISTGLFENYMVLNVDVGYKQETVFSFLNPEHVLEFKEIKDRCNSKKGNIERLQKGEFTDGVVINFMFRNMDYDKAYDMVEAVFPLERDLGATDTRLQGLLEYQLCVKNPAKILGFFDCSNEFKYEEYQKKLNKFNVFRTKCNGVYSSKRRVGGAKYET